MGQVQISKDGQPVILPWEEVTGQQLKEMTGIAPDRLVTVAEGGQTRAVGDGERVTLAPGAFVSDAPRFRYGAPGPEEAPDRVEVVLSEGDHARLTAHLLREDDPREQHAFLFAGLCESPRGARLLVRDLVPARPEDFLNQTPSYIELAPPYCLAATDRCRAEGLHLIECHSHPFASRGVAFSPLDVENEREKFAWYAEKWPWMRPATLVFGWDSVDGHRYDPARQAILPLTGLRVVGPHLRRRPATGAVTFEDSATPGPAFHRQELAFGAAGQARLRGTRVGLVGCGGLGSVLCEQLAYLGVRDFVLVDPDRVEETNLNRLVFALPEDARSARPKVEVMARGIAAVRPDADVETVCGSVADRAVQARLKDVDLLIAGADCDGARLVCAELAARYLLPYLDTGTGVAVSDGAVGEAVKLVTGLARPQALVLYDALGPSVRALVPPAPDPDCPVCSREALYARGDEADALAFARPAPTAVIADPTPASEPALAG